MGKMCLELVLSLNLGRRTAGPRKVPSCAAPGVRLTVPVDAGRCHDDDGVLVTPAVAAGARRAVKMGWGGGLEGVDCTGAVLAGGWMVEVGAGRMFMWWLVCGVP